MTRAQGAAQDAIAELLDRQRISEVLVRFARALDEKDWAGYAALYAEDGELVLPHGGHSGRVGMAEFVAADLGSYVATHHVTANHDISIDGDTAEVRSSLHATHVRSDDMRDLWIVGGFYRYTLRRARTSQDDSRWEITLAAPNPVWLLDSPKPANPFVWPLATST